MLARFIMLCFLGFASHALALAQPGPPQFSVGHIFVTEIAPEGCLSSFPINRIREIDPETGESWVFADDSDGLCTPNGLAFTPDGNYLRVLNYDGDTVVEFDARGNARVVYDFADGIFSPYGQNALTFDDDGYFYVSRNGNSAVLRFQEPDGPGAVYGPTGARGGLAFSGPILFVAQGVHYSVRIAPDGTWTPFDLYDGTTLCNAASANGDLFVGVVGADDAGVYHYQDADLANKRLLTQASFIRALDATYAIAISPDQTELYLVDSYDVWAVNIGTGSERLVAALPQREFFIFSGYGMAVATSQDGPVFAAGDLNCDGSINQFDINAFLLALIDSRDYATVYPQCNILLADLNSNGTVNPFDIQPFVELLDGP